MFLHPAVITMRATLFIIMFLLTLSTALAIDMPQAPDPPGAPGETPAPPPTPGAPEFSFARHARQQLMIKRISLPFYTTASSGSAVPIVVQVRNNDEASIRNGLSVTASIPALGIRKKSGPDTLFAKHEATKTVTLDIPKSAQPGIYLARITVSTDRFHRTVYHLVRVVATKE